MSAMPPEPRWLVLSDGPPPELQGETGYRVFLELRPGLAGAWTEKRHGAEVVLFGYPEASGNRWFQVKAIHRDGHNALSLAIERMIYARRVNSLAIVDGTLEEVARKGAKVHGGHVAIHRPAAGESREDFLLRVTARESIGTGQG